MADAPRGCSARTSRESGSGTPQVRPTSSPLIRGSRGAQLRPLRPGRVRSPRAPSRSPRRGTLGRRVHNPCRSRSRRRSPEPSRPCGRRCPGTPRSSCRIGSSFRTTGSAAPRKVLSVVEAHRRPHRTCEVRRAASRRGRTDFGGVGVVPGVQMRRCGRGGGGSDAPVTGRSTRRRSPRAAFLHDRWHR